MIGNLNLPFTFDRAREIERLRQAGRIAVRAAKSAAHLAGGVAILAIGGFAALTGLHGVRLPDAVLLQKAIEHLALPPDPPSALAERDMFLGMLAFGGCLMVAGFGWLAVWSKNPTAKPAAKPEG